jgi:Ser/Thr protein kinase RdoA (MazF antagonist)
MKYLKGKDIFPSELLELIQGYTQGYYVYIPKKEDNKEKWGAMTSYRKELEKRNSHVYTKYLTGCSISQIADNYHLSVKTVKRILLVKRKGAGEMKDKIMELLVEWGINSEINQIYDTVWTIGDDYVIKTNTDPADLERNIQMMKTLVECGIPVAKPIPTIEGQDYVECSGRYYLMMNKLTGKHVLDIYQEDYPGIAYETGKAVAKLHSAFLICEQKISFWDNSLVDEMNGWITDIMKENQYRYCSEVDFEEDLKELQACYDKLPRQLIHRDMHYGNILFDKGVFSGYIDFDLSQKNVRIFDICYFLMGLLINHEMKPDEVKQWYEIISNFIKGYEEINKLTRLEKDSMCCLMKSIELLFVAYFIQEEDELLAENVAKLYYFIKKNNDAICSAVYF